MKTDRLVIGSRASPLAMVQAVYVQDALMRSNPGLDVEIKKIKTSGDKILDVPLSRIGGKGLFTKEIEEALLGGRIDLAVHSMKDLPTELPKGLTIGAVTKREDPRDVLVSDRAHTLRSLPRGSRVGTSSLRRRSQLLRVRKDLEIVDLRGNLDTRVLKLRRGSYDAIVLAYAGIKRLGLDLNLSVMSVDDILPQAGQGALGIEVREDGDDAGGFVSALDDADSRVSIEAERTVLAALEGGCQVPIGIYAEITKDDILIKAGVFSLDGRHAVKAETAGKKEDAKRLAQALAESLLKKKAVCRILDEVNKLRRDI